MFFFLSACTWTADKISRACGLKGDDEKEAKSFQERECVLTGKQPAAVNGEQNNRHFDGTCSLQKIGQCLKSCYILLRACLNSVFFAIDTKSWAFNFKQ